MQVMIRVGLGINFALLIDISVLLVLAYLSGIQMWNVFGRPIVIGLHIDTLMIIPIIT